MKISSFNRGLEECVSDERKTLMAVETTNVNIVQKRIFLIQLCTPICATSTQRVQRMGLQQLLVSKQLECQVLNSKLIRV